MYFSKSAFTALAGVLLIHEWVSSSAFVFYVTTGDQRGNPPRCPYTDNKGNRLLKAFWKRWDEVGGCAACAESNLVSGEVPVRCCWLRAVQWVCNGCNSLAWSSYFHWGKGFPRPALMQLSPRLSPQCKFTFSLGSLLLAGLSFLCLCSALPGCKSALNQEHDELVGGSSAFLCTNCASLQVCAAWRRSGASLCHQTAL